jgi:predicted transcriptional regulator
MAKRRGAIRPELSTDLGRRERQIIDAVYRLGRASVSDVLRELPDPPSYSAVRGMLNLLEEKGHLRHISEGLRYVYLPVVAPADASRSAMAHVVRTFFAGSAATAATALFDLSDHSWSREELEQLSSLVKQAMKEGR